MIEMLVAITVLTVAISALLTLFVETALSLGTAGRQGTAVTLAEDQMEIYRTVPFDRIRLDGTLIPASGTYVTAHASDTNIPPSTGQALGGANGDLACPDSDFADACLPVNDVTGPDGHSYVVDTYIDYVNADGTFSIQTPASGLTLKLVTVVVYDGTNGDVLAEDSSAFQG